MRGKLPLLTLAWALGIGAASPPGGSLSNGLITLRYAAPDPDKGFNRGTRFDWSGVITSLRLNGRGYYAPWFKAVDPAVRDTHHGEDGITVGPNSAATGPAEEFLNNGKALGYDEAAPGGTFLKIGVGLLRRPDAQPYSQYRVYDLAPGSRWETRRGRGSVTFRQTVTPDGSGYGYVYEKTLRLVPGKPEMLIEHVLRNTGRQPIRSEVYDHNFLVTAGHVTGPDWEVTAPAPIKPTNAPDPLGRLDGPTLGFQRPLAFGERVFQQFDAGTSYDSTVRNKATGQGYRVQGDRPLAHATVWAVRPTVSLEPFVALDIAPGESTRWSYRYAYFTR